MENTKLVPLHVIVLASIMFFFLSFKIMKNFRDFPETYTGNPYPEFWALQEFFWKELKWYERENL